jgi:hypothetical protein
VVGIHRLRRACTFAANRFKRGTAERAKVIAPVDAFDREYSVTQMRHATEHFENWIRGEGSTQQRPSRPGYPYRPRFSSTVNGNFDLTAFSIQLDDERLDVLGAGRAASEMGRAVNNALKDAAERVVLDVWKKDGTVWTDPIA